MNALRLLALPMMALLTGCTLLASPEKLVPQPPAAVEDDITVYFSPKGGAMAAIIQQIENAKTSVDVQAYVFASKDLADALMAAHDRGVKVRIILDKDWYSAQFADAGVDVWFDSQHKEAHNKVVLVDGHVVITGSFNMTLASEAWNAENLLVIDHKPHLSAAYAANFEEHISHSTKMSKR
jgi:phosphatidylserine/phosphatidylglycerophosphate/cardiolipin synthase-like enzyme